MTWTTVEERAACNKCDGVCSEGHVGECRVVHVIDPRNDKDWETFSYCENAIREDRKDGFVVKELSEETP